MKQYLYDVQVKAARLSFTSVSPKCPQNLSSDFNFYTVFYAPNISTYETIVTFLLIFTPSLDSTFISTYRQTNYHILFNFYIVFTLSLRSTFISTYYQTNYHIPFNFYTVVYIQRLFQLSTKHELSQYLIMYIYIDFCRYALR